MGKEKVTQRPYLLPLALHFFIRLSFSKRHCFLFLVCLSIACASCVSKPARSCRWGCVQTPREKKRAKTAPPCGTRNCSLRKKTKQQPKTKAAPPCGVRKKKAPEVVARRVSSALVGKQFTLEFGRIGVSESEITADAFGCEIPSVPIPVSGDQAQTPARVNGLIRR